MTGLFLTSPGSASPEDFANLIERHPCGWRLDRLNPAYKDISQVPALVAAQVRILAHENGRLVGAAAIAHDDHASRLFDARVAQIFLLVGEREDVRTALLRACCTKLESGTWSQICYYEFDGAESPTGAESVGFELLDEGTLLGRLPASPSSSHPTGVALPTLALGSEMDALRELARRCAHSLPGLGPEVRAREQDLDADAVANCVRDGVVLVARADGEPVGFVALERSGKTTHLRLLAVSEGSRRRGVGTALVQATIDWARSNQMTSIVVATDAANVGALALYDRAGFTVVGRLRFLTWHASSLSSPSV